MSYSIGLRLSVSYLPTSARYPAGSFLPIRRNIDGIPLQLLAVGMYGHTKPGKFHDAVRQLSASRIDISVGDFESPRRGTWRVAVDTEPVDRRLDCHSVNALRSLGHFYHCIALPWAPHCRSVISNLSQSGDDAVPPSSMCFVSR